MHARILDALRFFLTCWAGLALGIRTPAAGAEGTVTNLPAQTKFFTGSSTCRECHGRFYQLWAPSHHGTALQSFAMARTNLTAPATEIRNGTNRYRVDLPAGQLLIANAAGEKRYPMELAMGGKNVFFFLTPWTGGRLQVLPLAYDLRRKEWYDTAASAVRHMGREADEALDWRESPFTFNTSCYNCHVSQLTNYYDLKQDTYHTAWAEPGINCETCHGPASDHVRIARETPSGQPLKELGLLSLKTFSPDEANSLCASCHAKIYPIRSSFAPKDRFFDHFGMAALEQADFYPDGRDLGENFTYTTWRLSPCLKASPINCVTCHTSSGRYRFGGAKANDACLPCHEQKVKTAAAHSHHPAGSEGAQCVACHMPMTEFARMRRSDHSMRPPMPAATLAFGSPNACNLCHTNHDAAWADREVRRWQSKDYQAQTLERGSWIAAARKRDWSKLPQILAYLNDPRHEEIWAASLLQLLRACDQDRKWPAVIASLKDVSPLVRAAAAEAIGDDLRPETVAPLLAAIRDDYRLVRVRAAAALAPWPEERVPESDRAVLRAALQELLSAYLARPDDAASHHNLGNYYLERHELPAAIASFETAVRLQPQDIASLVNVSFAYNLAGQNDKAERSLRLASRLAPTNAAVNLNLAMLLAEMDRLGEAEQAFRIAFKSDPKSAPAAFNLGVLLAKEHPEEALTWCRRAVELAPQEPKYAYTLAFYQHQQKQPNDAAKTLEKLVMLKPAYPDAYALLAEIYLDQGKPEKASSIYLQAVANEKLGEDDREQFRARLRTLSAK